MDGSRIMRPVKFVYHRYHYPPAVPIPTPTEELAQDLIQPGSVQGDVLFQAPTLDSARLAALAWFVKQLGLAVTQQQLLQVFEEQMSPLDWKNLLALLDWSIQNSESNQRHPRRGSVVRVTNLKDSGMPQRRRNILFVTGVFDFIQIMGQAHNIYLYTWFVAATDANVFERLKPYCAAIDKVSFLEFEHSGERLAQFVANVPIDIVHYEWPRSLTNFDASLGELQIFSYMECTSLRLLMDLRLKDLNSPAWAHKAIDVFNALKVELVDAAQMNARVVVTQKDGEFLARFAPQETFLVLHHGVNFDEFCIPDQEPEDHLLVFVGNFLHYPNVDGAQFFFSKVFDLIQAQVPDVRVLLAGANPTPEIMAYQDDRHVFVTGTVDDIRPYIQKASVCIAPLITGAGLRSKVIQYAALKRVCVATSIAATDLLFEDGKDIFIADDPDLFAQRIIYLLQHPDAARRMAESAYEKARFHYDNRKLVQELYGVYANLERANIAQVPVQGAREKGDSKSGGCPTN